jgi:fructose-1,6-bisphosphatase I
VSVCQPGDNLLAAGYCMYSSSVIFVLTIGTGVYVFTLDPMYGEFVLTQEKVQIPKAGKIYAFNEGNYALWDDKLKKYMDSLKEPGDSGKPYSARYIGSLVGDFHRTLLYGGIYGYPRDKKSKNGKLRLLYECAPMSFIVEQAGGKGSDGHQRILDITPTEVCVCVQRNAFVLHQYGLKLKWTCLNWMSRDQPLCLLLCRSTREFPCSLAAWRKWRRLRNSWLESA